MLLISSSYLKADEEHIIEQVESDLGIWPMIDLTFPLYKDKLSGYGLVLPVVIDADNQMNINPLILRGAIIASPTKNTSLWFAYDRASNWSHKVDFTEHRPWQQISQKHTFKKLDRLTINHRFRVEERIFEHTGTAIRLRYRAGATVGLGKTRRWYLVGNDEVLFYANKTKGREAGFSENRAFIGIGRKLTPNVSLEVGWQPSLINSAAGKSDIFRNYILTYLSIRIPYKSSPIKAPATGIK